MHVHVQRARREDLALARHHLGGNAHGHARGHALHRVGITGLADAGDDATGDADVGLVDARPVNHDGVGDDEVQSFPGRHTRGLTHTLAQDLAPAEAAFVPVAREVLLHLHTQAGVSQPQAVSHCRAIHGRVRGAREGRAPRLRALAKAPDVLVAQEALLPGPLDGPRAVFRLVDWAVDEAIAPAHHTEPCDLDEGDGLLLTRFEAHRRA